jgi:predicted Zn-dependent protease
MPPLSKQSYPSAGNFSVNTENLSSEKRAEYLSYIINESVKKDVTCAGLFDDDVSFSYIISSNGLEAYNKGTKAGLSATVRTKDGSGSGRFDKSYVDVNNLQHKRLSDWVIERSLLSQNPVELKPGKYTVILEPAAAADMVALCLNFMNARPADEGRSYFSKPGGGNIVGEQMVNKNVFLYSDPADADLPSVPFNNEGLPRKRTVWFENGILKNLHMNRYWAENTSKEPVSYPSNLILTGSDKSVEQLIAETDYAILVTRFWYIRTVEQKTMLVTGLTRDGVFEVKEGKIKRPIKNFRFNEAPINVLKNLVDMSKPEKASGSENEWLQIYVPALKVTDFNFSSLSDAI